MIVSKTTQPGSNGQSWTYRTLRQTIDPASLRVVTATEPGGNVWVFVLDGGLEPHDDELRVYVAEDDVNDDRIRELVQRYLLRPKV